MERKMIMKERPVKKAPRAYLFSGEKPSPSKAKPWNPYAAECPTRLVLDRIGDKWTVLLLGLLESKPVRFNRLNLFAN